MPGKNDGVVGSSIVESIVERVGRWIEKYEEAVREERTLREQLRRIERLLKETENAAYVIDVTKLQQQKKENEDKLKTVQQRRLNLEWLAVAKIKKGEWNPQLLIEYSFVRDLLFLDKVREEQTREICRNCKECQIIRVKTDRGELPLEVVTKPEKARSLPYMPYYSLKEIWQTKEQLQMNVKSLGPLTPEEKMELEKWVSERLALHRNLLNSFIEEKRVVIPSRKLLHRGCTRKLPKALPIVRKKEIGEEDGDPRAADHFPEDVVAEVNEDGSYSRVYLSSRHGSEESE
jgi:hypothetical protein